MREFISIATIYHKQTNNENQVTQLVEELSNLVEHSELILLIRDYQDFNSQLFEHELSRNNVQVKIVSTYKYTKEYIFENIAWQAAIGDHLIYDQSLNYILHNIEKLIEHINQKNHHICWISHGQNNTLSKTRQRTIEKVNDEYSQHGHIISSNTQGYIIDRYAINAGFNNQKEQYDPFLSLATCGLKSESIELIKSFNEQEDHFDNYDTFDMIDMLVYYTKFGAHKLLTMPLMILVAFMSILFTTIQIPILHQMIGFTTIIAIVLIVTYPHYVAIRQTFAAANEKNVVGHFEIKKV